MKMRALNNRLGMPFSIGVEQDPDDAQVDLPCLQQHPEAT